MVRNAIWPRITAAFGIIFRDRPTMYRMTIETGLRIIVDERVGINLCNTREEDDVHIFIRQDGKEYATIMHKSRANFTEPSNYEVKA